MTDLDLLLLILIAIYFVECHGWAPESAQVFRRSRSGWNLSTPLFTLTAAKRNLHLSRALPGWGSIALCQLAPPSLSPAGFLLEGPDRRSEEFKNVQAEDIAIKQALRPIFRAGTPVYAAFLTNIVREFPMLSAEERLEKIRQEFDRLLNVSAAQRRFACYKRLERFLTFDCILLALWVLVGFPLVAYLRGLYSAWFLAVPALLSLIRVLWLFRRIHHVLYPGHLSTCRTHITEMTLMPLTAIRAHDRLTRELFGNFHWLAVAPVLCDLESARNLAERALRDLEYAIREESVESSGAEWLHLEWRDAVRRHVRRMYGEPQLLLSSPARRSPDSVSYCPRCCEEYLLPDGVCHDCSGVPLRRFQELVT